MLHLVAFQYQKVKAKLKKREREEEKNSRPNGISCAAGASGDVEEPALLRF